MSKSVSCTKGAVGRTQMGGYTHTQGTWQLRDTGKNMVSMTVAMWKPPPERSRNQTEQRKLDWTGTGWQSQRSLKIIWSFEHLQKLQRIRKSRTNLFIPFPEQIANLHFLHFEWMILLTNGSDFFFNFAKASDCSSAENVMFELSNTVVFVSSTFCLIQVFVSLHKTERTTATV